MNTLDLILNIVLTLSMMSISLSIISIAIHFLKDRNTIKLIKSLWFLNIIGAIVIFSI